MKIMVMITSEFITYVYHNVCQREQDFTMIHTESLKSLMTPHFYQVLASSSTWHRRHHPELSATDNPAVD